MSTFARRQPGASGRFTAVPKGAVPTRKAMQDYHDASGVHAPSCLTTSQPKSTFRSEPAERLPVGLPVFDWCIGPFDDWTDLAGGADE
jgi:hypothetical protein